MDHLALLLAILSAVLTVVGGWLVWRVLDREVKDETQGWQQARRQCQQAVLTRMSVAEGAALAPCGAQAAGIARAIDLADKGILSFHVGKRLVVTLRAPQLARQPAERLLLHRVFDRVEIGQTARVGASSRWDDADRIMASNADDRLVQRGVFWMGLDHDERRYLAGVVAGSVGAIVLAGASWRVPGGPGAGLLGMLAGLDLVLLAFGYFLAGRGGLRHLTPAGERALAELAGTQQLVQDALAGRAELDPAQLPSLLAWSAVFNRDVEWLRLMHRHGQSPTWLQSDHDHPIEAFDFFRSQVGKAVAPE